MTVLILGGTAEARALADGLVAAGVPLISSLAGRVQHPRLPAGPVRSGGFGGAEGLARYLQSEQIELLVDATHPYATAMTANAAQAARLADVPAVRLARPGWSHHPDADSWTWVDDHQEALQAAEDHLRHTSGVPFLSTGRQTLAHYAAWREMPVLVRVVEPLDDAPTAWTVVLDRGPYTLESERELLQRNNIGVLLSKDSGGAYTAAKLTAAGELGVPVVVVRRPDVPSGLVEEPSVEAVLGRIVAGRSATD